MLTKTKVLKTIKQLPDEFSLDEIIDRMILLEKIGIGIAQAERGEVISHEDVQKEIDKWLV